MSLYCIAIQFLLVQILLSPIHLRWMCAYLHLSKSTSAIFSLVSSSNQWSFNSVFQYLYSIRYPCLLLIVELYFDAIMVWEMLGMFVIFMNLLIFVFCSRMWAILETVPCTLKKTVYSSFWVCSAPYISMRSTSSNSLFKAAVFLFIFYLYHLSLGNSRVLKCLIAHVFRVGSSCPFI